MLRNHLLDPVSVSEYHKEYLNLINFYKNHQRPSIFVKYYNINYDHSVFDENTSATYDTYTTSKIAFDVYDLTPTFMINPITNSTSNVPDMAGQMFESTTSIVTHTIDRPRVNDIVSFYDPIKSDEIYRVMNYRVAINALHAGEQSVPFYELDLEPAPFKNLNKLNVLTSYVYDLDLEQYLSREQYVFKMNKFNEITDIVNQLIKFYDSIRDIYRVNYTVPIIANQIIYNFKKTLCSNNRRSFEQMYIPFGLFDQIPETNNYDMGYINDEEFQLNSYRIYEIHTNMIRNVYFDIENFNENILDTKHLIFKSKQLYNTMNELKKELGT